MNTISPDFFYKSCEINWEWRTEKPFKKNKNLGNIVIFWNFFSMNNTKWKSFFLKTKSNSILEMHFEKILNLNKIDFRDLCLKRGKIVRKLFIRIFSKKKLNFFSINIFNKFLFGIFKKDFVFINWNRHQKIRIKLHEKITVKALIKINLICGEINKFLLRNKAESKNKEEVIFDQVDQPFNKKKMILFGQRFSDFSINKKNLILYLNAWCQKKKFFELVKSLDLE